jgi:hypothetical protein
MRLLAATPLNKGRFLYLVPFIYLRESLSLIVFLNLSMFLKNCYQRKSEIRRSPTGQLSSLVYDATPDSVVTKTNGRTDRQEV